MKKLTILLLFISQVAYTQSTIVAETINKIELQEDTIQSVFNWLTDNIRYDVKKLNDIKSKSRTSKKSKIKTSEERQELLLQRVIKRKKGVCEDYSILFNAIVSHLGYESYIIEGYTKNSKGKLNRKIGHTWNAVKVNGTWKLYDPTWGAGYVENNKRFVKKFNAEWYDVSSSEMIKTHMPFDPVWQLSNYPITYEHFENDIPTTNSKDHYNYEELLKIHGNKSEKEQMRDQVNRSQEIGDGTRLIAKWRKIKTKRVNLHGIHNKIGSLDEANNNFNHSVKLFNDYITAKNKRFKGRKWTPAYAKQNLEKAKSQMETTVEIYKSIDIEDKKATRSINKALRESEKLIIKIDRELDFVEKLKSK